MTEPADDDRPPVAAKMPLPPVARWTRPLVRFLHVESAGGVVLLACTVAALALANSPWAEHFAHFWHTPVRLEIGGFRLGGDLGHFVVNDVLMTVFFFVVGLEIKREVVDGELRDPRKAALPVAAALGGMLAPAGIYLTLQAGQPGARGWGVPMATDIAFVVGVMALLGRRVPFGLKIMLLSLAIADDIGAVLVIAAFYSTNLAWGALGLAALGFAAVYLMNRVGVRAVPLYVVVGAGVWLAFLKSGVHPTVAGVILGLMTPARAWLPEGTLSDVLREATRRLDRPGPDRSGTLGAVRVAAREGVSPLERLEAALHPWVSFGIMPLFALANAGVKVEPAAFADPIALAVALGLFAGKPVGIVLFSWLAVRAGVGKLPGGVTWAMMAGAGALGGIGFTMSLFVAGLAFADPAHLAAGKIGTLSGSVCSAAAGVVILVLVGRRATEEKSI